MIDSVPVFIGITILFMGGCAFMTGNALARTWRPWWMGALYALGLGAADRFIGFALFGGSLLSPGGYVIDTMVLEAITLAAWRVTLAKRMCDQYPWLYQRSGLFGWTDKIAHRH
ncbi:conserved membrane hypothetical protein [Magnetospirillum sp. LM-5]|uniref:DUF6867 family protein n=1 Tax=Magnetospirillum sp. LM-5 TaxID=2681466 RepID=UPI00137E23C5|nr:hypothetical protein [Magnetospirillum sp. LM-5]CAA7611848.1 conserved membrane hypothetical protein [Magnetospirillum sp. LM-5]